MVRFVMMRYPISRARGGQLVAVSWEQNSRNKMFASSFSFSLPLLPKASTEATPR